MGLGRRKMVTAGARTALSADDAMASAAAADGRNDAELIAEAAAGDESAVEVLYARHAEPVWRVAHAVSGHADDAGAAVSDAFVRVIQAPPEGSWTNPGLVRIALLSEARSAAIDRSRWRARSDEPSIAAAAANASTVALAFRSMPERLRSSLWLTEVEGVSPRDAAPLLGLTAASAAQLALEARTTLQSRLVEANAAEVTAAACRIATEQLGGYMSGRLSPGELAALDQHLAACAECRARRDDLEDVGRVLRRGIVPIPFGLARTVLATWAIASAAATAGIVLRDAVSGVGRAVDVATRAQVPLRVVTSGMLALGMATGVLNVLGAQDPTSRDSGAAAAPAAPHEGGAETPEPDRVPEAPVLVAEPSAVPVVAVDVPLAPAPALAATAPPIDVPQILTDPAPTAAPVLPAAAPAEPPPAPPAPSDPTDPADPGIAVIGVAAVVGDVSVGVIIGDQCQGGYVESADAGECSAPEATAENAGIKVITDGSTPIGDQEQSIGI